MATTAAIGNWLLKAAQPAQAGRKAPLGRLAPQVHKGRLEPLQLCLGQRDQPVRKGHKDRSGLIRLCRDHKGLSARLGRKVRRGPKAWRAQRVLQAQLDQRVLLAQLAQPALKAILDQRALKAQSA